MIECHINGVIQDIFFGTGFSHSASFPQGSSRLLSESIPCSFLVLSSNLWSGCTLVIHPLKDIWEFLVFSDYAQSHCRTFRSMFLHENMLCFLWDICPQVHLLGYMVSPSFVFQRKGPAALQSGCTILHSYQLRSSDAASSPILASWVWSLVFILAIPLGIEC